LNSSHESEIQRIKEIYEQRDIQSEEQYSALNPAQLHTIQERDRVIARFLRTANFAPNSMTKSIDIGGGSGKGASWLISLGVAPENIVVNDLMANRLEQAKKLLPAGVNYSEQDASHLPYPDGSFDIVMQSVVFSSVLESNVQQALANSMWRLLKPGGGIYWYDFTLNNPKNKDVQGVPLARVKELFPNGNIVYKKVTLAPPISRRVCSDFLSLYGVFNSFPFLRSHLVCWITHRN